MTGQVHSILAAARGLPGGLTLALAMAVAPGPAAAWSVDEVVEARILPGWRTAQGTHMAALKLTLAEGWKTYWRAPGENGVPPRFDWTGSENLVSVRMHWPRPTVFDDDGLRTIGFARELVLPMEVTLADDGAAARVMARIDLGVCETVCVPVTLHVDAPLPAVGAGGDGRIGAALAAVPEPAAAAGLTGAHCAIAPIADGLRLTATLDMPPLGGAEVTVIELADPAVWVSEASSRRDGNRLTAQADLMAMDGGAVMLERAALRITVLAEGRAVELTGCAAP